MCAAPYSPFWEWNYTINLPLLWSVSITTSLERASFCLWSAASLYSRSPFFPPTCAIGESYSYLLSFVPSKKKKSVLTLTSKQIGITAPWEGLFPSPGERVHFTAWNWPLFIERWAIQGLRFNFGFVERDISWQLLYKKGSLFLTEINSFELLDR